jgi:hypothetical protein
VSGIEEGVHYNKSELTNVTAQLPNQEYKDVTVTVNEKKFDNITIENNNISMDLSSLERGCYVVRIVAKTQFNFMLRKVVNIYVE